MGKKLVQGVGVNDADYEVTISEHRGMVNKHGRKVKSIIWECPYYTKWRNMIKRCYSPSYLKQNPTYKDCFMCAKWLTFSNFKLWMNKQDFLNKHLDKDLLHANNRLYSPETCVFVAKEVNLFIGNNLNSRGDCLIGCNWKKASSKFVAECRNPFNSSGCERYLGYYNTELEAHLAWKKQKHLYACQLAESEYVTDERVRQVLLHRYENYTIVEEHLK